jgi:hypothetical protein
MRPSSLHKAGTELSASIRRSPSVKVSDLLIIDGTCPNHPNPGIERHTSPVRPI